jgi:prepilin signal peptidase PulO-like enzyme (type II secretory pathway)
MNTFLFLLSGFLGAMIGSFLNVVIYRFGASAIHKGRSICLSCGEKIRMRDLMPIFSYVFLGGKCRGCKTVISPQYILVELTMTVLGFMVYLSLPSTISLFQTISYIIYYIILFALLLTIGVYDYKHKIIPDEFSFTFALVALLGLFVSVDGIIIPSFGTLLAGPLLALPTALIFFVSKGKWMGLGDSKLFLGIGWMLGLVLGFSAFVLSFWIGAIVSLAVMRMPGSPLKLKSQIPFAPFIIVATIFVFFTKVDVLGLSYLLN